MDAVSDTTRDALWAKAYPDLRIQNNPSIEELRSLAKAGEVTTEFGAPAYRTIHPPIPREGGICVAVEGVPGGRSQHRLGSRLTKTLMRDIRETMPTLEWLSLDRCLGRDDAKFHCRLLIPKTYARAALFWARLAFPAEETMHDARREPDFLTICLPDPLSSAVHGNGKLPTRLMLFQPEAGVTLILGMDCAESIRMSFMAQAMYRAKSSGGLGLHAGSKLIRVAKGEKLQDRGVLIVGGPGAGKTALTLESHGITPPESMIALQDDVVLLTPDGRAHGLEDNFLVRTEGLTNENHPGLHFALMNSDSMFENVTVNSAGKVQSLDGGLGMDGRAVAIRSRIPHTAETIDLERVHKLVFLVRYETIIPPLARLTKEQAAAVFMLGVFPEKPAEGEPSPTPGFNPFSLGPEKEEGNRLCEILNAHPDMDAYILNTGSIGRGADAKGFDPKGTKILKGVSAKLLASIARQEPGAMADWSRDAFWGFEVPRHVPGIPLWNIYNPKRHYRGDTYLLLCQQLRQQWRDWLGGFTGLAAAIRRAI